LPSKILALCTSSLVFKCVVMLMDSSSTKLSTWRTSSNEQEWLTASQHLVQWRPSRRCQQPIANLRAMAHSTAASPAHSNISPSPCQAHTALSSRHNSPWHQDLYATVD
jgi:hypothetical protein